MPFANYFLIFAALNGFVAVGLGAFGAHALKAKLSPAMLAVWQTAVQYHFYHVLALLGVVLMLRQGWQSGWLAASGWLFCIGILLFCASLYALALGGPRWLGPVTPLGGLAFMLGWVSLLIAALRGLS